MSEKLLIMGASVRAAAWSARRARFSVFAADLFADVDLKACAGLVRVDDYPSELVAVGQTAPPGPWMYTGGLENHPSIVDAISLRRPLWGISGRGIRRVRSPDQLEHALRANGLLYPAWSDLPPSGPDPWLKKRRASCGGLHVQPVVPRTASPGPTGSRSEGIEGRSDEPEQPRGRDHWYQQFVDGTSCSAVFVATDQQCRLLGVSRQLTGNGGLDNHAPRHPFRYVGSVGPLDLGDKVENSFREVGICLAERFQLRGLFGVDAILAGGRVWTIEVNPRYTASVEVLERASGFSALRLHADAFAGPCWPSRPEICQSVKTQSVKTHTQENCGRDDATGVAGYRKRPNVCGKAVVYAPRSARIGSCFSDYVSMVNGADTSVWIADIPAVDANIRDDCPICSIIVEASSADEIQDRFRETRIEILRRLDAGALGCDE